MAKDVKDAAGDAIGAAFGTIAREIGQSVSGNGHSGPLRRGGNGFSGARGLAVGAVLATAVPLAGKAVRKLVVRTGGEAAQKLAAEAKDSVGKGVGEAVGEVGDAPGIAKSIGKKMIPGLGGGGDGEKGGGNKGASGVGKGRRMPVQQAVDVGVPLSTAYNQWTQFEEWPQFMHRIDQATQEDDCTVSFRTKIWGMSKEFAAQIMEQRPDERIQWRVEEGVVHSGVVTFHELAPRLTRVQVSLDLEPGSLIEKAARGMRHLKRAVRGDLARFKAYIEMEETETGAWRGVIHEGEVAENGKAGKEESKGGAKKGGKEAKAGGKKPSSRSRGGGRSRAKKRPGSSSRSRQRSSSRS